MKVSLRGLKVLQQTNGIPQKHFVWPSNVAWNACVIFQWFHFSTFTFYSLHPTRYSANASSCPPVTSASQVRKAGSMVAPRECCRNHALSSVLALCFSRQLGSLMWKKDGKATMGKKLGFRKNGSTLTLLDLRGQIKWFTLPGNRWIYCSRNLNTIMRPVTNPDHLLCSPQSHAGSLNWHSVMVHLWYPSMTAPPT